MPRLELVGSICQPYNYGSRDKDGLDFIQCVDGRQPKTHGILTLGNNIITPKVYPFACVDVGAFIRDCFVTYHLTENGRRVPMFGR